ncbi:MAG TPA: DUF423 domain-containing protein [Polyangiaceae bacterium]|nr:DUF423 domain-containing protein [Polyangiaceae bacterium]
MDWLKVSAALGFAGVALGAFGAHGLRHKLTPQLLDAYQTGVLYHLIHAVALFGLALYARTTSVAIGVPASLFALGILLFSGSLYLLAVTSVNRLGLVTPLGGLCFLAAWAALFWLKS